MSNGPKKAQHRIMTGVPVAADLDVGEIVINETTQILYTKNTSGTVVTLGDDNVNWADPVDANVIPDADSSRNIGTSGTRFANVYSDAINVQNNVTVGGTVDGRDVLDDGQAGDNLVTLSGVARDATNLGNFTGAIVTTNTTVKTALQDLETDIEDRFITVDTTWQVGSGQTYTTMDAALDDARNYTIVGKAWLYINVDAGTYKNEVFDFSHAQSKNIWITGVSAATTIFEYDNTQTDDVCWDFEGNATNVSFDETAGTAQTHYFGNITFKHTGAVNNPYCVMLVSPRKQVTLVNCIVEVNEYCQEGVWVSGDLQISNFEITTPSTLRTDNTLAVMLDVYRGGRISSLGTLTIDYNYTGTFADGIYLAGGHLQSSGAVTLTTAHTTGTNSYGISIWNQGTFATISNLSITDYDIGIWKDQNGSNWQVNGTLTQTTVTTEFEELQTGNGFLTGCKVALNADQNLAATYANITWETETWDIGNNYVDPNFTAPISGRYLVMTRCYYTGLTGGDYVQLRILNNGTNAGSTGITIGIASGFLHFTTVLEVAKGATIRAQTANVGGARGAVSSSAGESYMSIEYLGS